MRCGMEILKGEFQERMKTQFGRVLDRNLFFFLLDLEVKRARRYQNFLCLMLLKIKKCSDNCWDLNACYETLGDLLTVEMRESDIVGSLEGNKLAVLLPYADAKAGTQAKSRFEDTLKYYDFKNKGFEIMIDQICFPINGNDTIDIIKKALGIENS